jgi:MFS transporter, DHA2 family, multidrug resistance protein
MVTLDATVVNVAQRTLIDVFSATPAIVAWSVTGYALALAAAIPLTGWAAGWWGTKVPALGAVVVFSWASLLCSEAPNIAALVAFRVLQGLGGGTLVSLPLIILARAAGPARLRRVLTIGMIPILVAAICGPILGGWLIDSFGWKSIFLINIPIGLLALVFAGLVLPEDDPLPAAPLEVIGTLLLFPGLVLVLYGVSLLPGRGTIADPNVWFPAMIGLLLLGAFVIRARRRADRALIDLRSPGNRDVAAADATRFLFAIAFFGCCCFRPTSSKCYRRRRWSLGCFWFPRPWPPLR